jgi:hypothetical protein
MFEFDFEWGGGDVSILWLSFTQHKGPEKEEEKTFRKVESLRLVGRQRVHREARHQLVLQLLVAVADAGAAVHVIK